MTKAGRYGSGRTQKARGRVGTSGSHVESLGDMPNLKGPQSYKATCQKCEAEYVCGSLSRLGRMYCPNCAAEHRSKEMAERHEMAALMRDLDERRKGKGW